MTQPGTRPNIACPISVHGQQLKCRAEVNNAGSSLGRLFTEAIREKPLSQQTFHESDGKHNTAAWYSSTQVLEYLGSTLGGYEQTDSRGGGKKSPLQHCLTTEDVSSGSGDFQGNEDRDRSDITFEGMAVELPTLQE